MQSECINFVVLGEGFDKINTEKMRDEKVMYSLSRYYMLDKTSQCNLANMKLPSDYMGEITLLVFPLTTMNQIQACVS